MAIILVNVLAGCYNGANDNKNDARTYLTYDTTDQVENINSTGTMKDSVMRTNVK